MRKYLVGFLLVCNSFVVFKVVQMQAVLVFFMRGIIFVCCSYLCPLNDELPYGRRNLHIIVFFVHKESNSAPVVYNIHTHMTH